MQTMQYSIQTLLFNPISLYYHYLQHPSPTKGISYLVRSIFLSWFVISLFCCSMFQKNSWTSG